MKEYKTRCKQYAVVDILQDKVDENGNFTYYDIYGINNYKRFDNFERAKQVADKLYIRAINDEKEKNCYKNYAVLEEWCIKRVYRNTVLKVKIVYCANKNFKY